jgi:hypothetical protein
MWQADKIHGISTREQPKRGSSSKQGLGKTACFGGSVATGRASHAGKVKGDDPNEKRYPGPPGLGLGHGADNPISIK